MANPDDQEPDAPMEGQEFSEEAFEAKLREMGRLRQPTGKVPKPEGPFTPVRVKGKTLSESLIEERR